MVKLFFLLSLFFTTNLLGQTLDGFWGIKFGSSIETVKKVMLSKPNSTIDNEHNDSTQIIFDGVEFAGRKTLFIRFLFVNKKFYTASVFMSSKLESQTVDLFKDIKNEINQKYYKSEVDRESYKPPYEKGDGHTETAIKIGKAIFETFWTFKNTDKGENYIVLEINDDLHIILSYQDGDLAALAFKKKKEKNNNDY